jgi:FtsH-binding integral membrane protein
MKISLSKVYKNTGNNHSVSLQTFYGMIAGFVCYGLFGTAIVAHLAIKAGYQLGWPSLIVFGLVIPIIGIIIAGFSKNWFVSFIGYNMVLIPFGVILAPVVNSYSADVIRNAFAVTAIITFLMGLAGTIFPNVFSRLGPALFLSLSMLVLVRIAGLFIPELNNMSIIDYIAAGIFSLYIGYDMYRASVVERTWDNAVDIALSLYLDIINLFLQLLKILGNSRD